MKKPLVSIVIPTRNGGDTLPSLFESVSRQRVPFPYEVVVVDSGSTDGSLALIHRRADRVIEISPASFDHGLTRNLGVAQAHGELVALLVQDAVPFDDRWLSELTAPLLSHANVAGAFARQRPRPDASAITRYYHDRWLASMDAERVVAVVDAGEFDVHCPLMSLPAVMKTTLQTIPGQEPYIKADAELSSRWRKRSEDTLVCSARMRMASSTACASCAAASAASGGSRLSDPFARR